MERFLFLGLDAWYRDIAREQRAADRARLPILKDRHERRLGQGRTSIPGRRRRS